MSDTDLLSQLCTPDERTLAHSPLGLGGRLLPEDAARFQAAAIEQAQLAKIVPEGIRNYFERIRKLHLHGVLEYEFFFAAHDLRLLAIEAALRVRFVEHYSGRIPIIAKGRKVSNAPAVMPAVTTKGAAATLLARNFDDVWHAAPYWHLGPLPWCETTRLPTGLEALLAWARREGLLPGRRTRFVDQALVKLRNWAAHPTDYTLVGPPESAGGLQHAAELINKLWGIDTPNGHLFPPPVYREPRVAAIAADGKAASTMRLDQVAGVEAKEKDYEFAVFLAAPHEQLTRRGAEIRFAYRDGVQTTQFPCRQLFRGNWLSFSSRSRAESSRTLPTRSSS